MSPEMAHIRIRHRVEWLDTDAAGIYHWTTIARFSESAEAALHTALGIAGETFGVTPRLRVGFEFHRPLRFNDEAWVDFGVEAVGRSSVTYGFTVSTLDGEPVATGSVVTCLVQPGGGRSRPWPDHISSALRTGGRQTAPGAS